jgi:hypothetical protein
MLDDHALYEWKVAFHVGVRLRILAMGGMASLLRMPVKGWYRSMYSDAEEVRLDELVSGSFPHSPAAANSSLKARKLRFCSRNAVM